MNSLISAVPDRAQFTVVVKRSTGAAIARDLDRHLSVEFQLLNAWKLPDGGEARITFTVAGPDRDSTGDALRRWFAEGDDQVQDQPYPAGSLLWFRVPEAVR